MWMMSSTEIIKIDKDDKLNKKFVSLIKIIKIDKDDELNKNL